jgi:hypothetical protein
LNVVNGRLFNRRVRRLASRWQRRGTLAGALHFDVAAFGTGVVESVHQVEHMVG